MKRVIGLLLAFGAASCSIALGRDEVSAANRRLAIAKTTIVKKLPPKKRSGPPPIAYKDLAPADEYFGPLKLSILGIKNTTSDAGKRYVFGIRDATATMSTAAFVDASVHDWARRYPRDLEVARALFYLQRLYAMVDLPAAQTKAKGEASWMFASYASTPQARQLRRVLASAPAPIGVSTPAPIPAPSPGDLVPIPIASPGAPEPAATGSQPSSGPSVAPAPVGSPAPIGSPEPLGTSGAASIETSPSDGFARPSGASRARPGDAAPPATVPAAIPSTSPAIVLTAAPAVVPAMPAATAAASPAPRRATGVRTSRPALATPDASASGGPTPFPTPIQPSAAEIDGTASPAPR